MKTKLFSPRHKEIKHAEAAKKIHSLRSLREIKKVSHQDERKKYVEAAKENVLFALFA